MSINISCVEDQCPMCKGNSPPVTDKRSSISCVGCDTRFHKKCARNLSKLDNGAFSVCCDDSADRSILVPPTSSDNDDGDLDFDSLPESFNLSKSQLNVIIQNAASKAARETIETFSETIKKINKSFSSLESKAAQIEKSYKELARKIQEAESLITSSFESNCELMYAEFSDRDRRKRNIILHNLPEPPNSNLKKQVVNILSKL